MGQDPAKFKMLPKIKSEKSPFLMQITQNFFEYLKKEIYENVEKYLVSKLIIKSCDQYAHRRHCKSICRSCSIYTKSRAAKIALKICASRKIKLTRTVYSARSPADRLLSN